MNGVVVQLVVLEIGYFLEVDKYLWHEGGFIMVLWASH
jgi:hypothetical protein